MQNIIIAKKKTFKNSCYIIVPQISAQWLYDSDPVKINRNIIIAKNKTFQNSCHSIVPYKSVQFLYGSNPVTSNSPSGIIIYCLCL